MLLGIALGAFVAVVLLAIGIERRVTEGRSRLRERVARIARDDYSPIAVSGTSALRLDNYSSIPFLQAILRRSPSAARLADDLDRAAVPLRAGEFLIGSAGIGVVGAVLAATVFGANGPGLIIAAFAGAAGSMLPRLLLRMRFRRRQAALVSDLPDGLDILSRGLRSGIGLLGAIDAVVEQVGGVLGHELDRVRTEIAANLTVEQAFNEFDRRMQSPDLHIIVTAILVQREVGGSLAEILDNVAHTMRERVRLHREMRSLTAEQRLSAYIIAVVPVGILICIALLDYELVRPLFERGSGQAMLGLAAALEVAGLLVMLQIASSYEV